MEELKKFFLEEGFDLPWWFETTAEQAILDIHIEDENICKEFDVLHVPVKDISDVTVTEKEELERSDKR